MYGSSQRKCGLTTAAGECLLHAIEIPQQIYYVKDRKNKIIKTFNQTCSVIETFPKGLPTSLNIIVIFLRYFYHSCCNAPIILRQLFAIVGNN